MNRAGIALGSNLGDRVGLMKAARDACMEWNAPGQEFLQSALYETDPVGGPGGSPAYLNAVVELAWEGSPEALLLRCQRLEQKLGRERSGVDGEPRTIDVDILYVGGAMVESPELVLPHPRCHQRKFVLKPLSDIRAGLVLPGQVDSVARLLEQVPAAEADPVLFREQW